jgi:very-short-patch-repair endonuclease
MLLSLAVAAARSGVPALIYEGHPAPFDDRDEELRGLVTIQPQVMVGKYRIDFEVGYHLMLGPQDRNARLKPGDPAEPIPGDLTWHRALVLVECDGHEFHEKTKEQASRDKRRDRDLQVAGFTIFRYSGSDVWRDCIATAEEVVRVAYQRAVASPAAARKSLPPFR